MTLAAQENRNHYIFRHRRADKTIRDVAVYRAPVLLQGKPLFYSIIFDITEQKEAERKLAQQVDKMQSIFRAAPIGIGVVVYRELREVNERLCDMTGYDAAELIGKNARILYPSPEEFDYVGEEKYRQITEKGTGTAETRWLKKDGTPIDVLLSSSPIHYADLSLGVTFTALDITERKRREQQVRLLGEIADMAPATIVVHDFDGRFYYANDQALKNYGYGREEFMGLGLKGLDTSESADLIPSRMQWLRERGELSFEAGHRRKDGSVVPMQVFARVVKWGGRQVILSVSSDLTERKQAEDFMIRTQKLESLGILAGGIAHDFNNLLGIIFGNIDLARMVCPEDSKVKECLDRAFSGMSRAKDLTQQLITFSKGGSPIKRTASPAGIIKEAVKFALSGSNCGSRFHIEDGLWFCDFDENQIAQVIDNIVINAQQAMPMGGAIAVEARNVRVQSGEAPGLTAGRYVKISVRDQGIGIAPSILPRIFDPFFTTKQKGYGLGLATAYSIIKKHGGDIAVDSTVNQGSTFHVLLPAAEGEASPLAETIKETHGGTGRFLVMDDEVMLLEMAGDILKDMGYDVTTATDGRSAIDLFKKAKNSRKPFTGVIMDLTIPGGMGGKEAIEEIRKLDKDVPAIVSSGYSDDPVMSDPGNYGFTASITKPYSLHELVKLLNRIFNQRL
jgi:PAS domain S-box-containing protein